MADEDGADVYDDLIDADSGGARQLHGGTLVAPGDEEVAELRLRLAAATDEVRPRLCRPRARARLPAANCVSRPATNSLQVERLRIENDLLRRNISTLYNTAKLELARKDRQIAALRAPAEGRR